MPTFFFLIIAILCVGAVKLVLNAYASINSKSKIPYTDNRYLQDRQELIEAVSAPNVSVFEKPKSNLRGVQNKRFRKK